MIQGIIRDAAGRPKPWILQDGHTEPVAATTANLTEYIEQLRSELNTATELLVELKSKPKPTEKVLHIKRRRLP